MIGAAREPIRVGLSERDVIAVARALFGQGSYAAIEPTLTSTSKVEKLGPTAMSLLEATLATGVVKTLARLGGAQPRLRPGTPGAALPMRVFEVRPVPVLAFGSYSFELVRWMASEPIDLAAAPKLTVVPRTVGDHVLAYLALRLVAGTRLERALARQPALRASPLAWLGHARALARAERSDEAAPAEPPALARILADEEGRIVVECLAADLALRWTSAALAPPNDLLDAADALRIAIAEQQTLDALLDAVERLGRWDLATFLVDAGARLLPRGTSAAEAAARTAPAVRPTGLLRERSEARRQAGAVFRALVRIGARSEELALVRFFEDGYEDAQSLLSSWEPLGRDGFARAEDVLRALAALDAPAPLDAPARSDKEEK